jgi:hypothetical protein
LFPAARTGRIARYVDAAIIAMPGMTDEANAMTPKQADDGVLELGLPGGGSVLFVIDGDVPDRPDVDAELIAAMLAADDEVDPTTVVVGVGTDLPGEQR